jgi:putative redox protein
MRVEFATRNGVVREARLELPVDRKPAGCALLVHRFPWTSGNGVIGSVSRALTRLGIGVLRFDYTHPHAGDGAPAKSDLPALVDDVLDAAAYLGAECMAPAILIGHSLGGAAVLEAAHSMPSVRAIATIGAPFVSGVDGEDAPDRIARLRRALLVMHAPMDEVVGIDHAGSIYRAARHPKSFVSLNDADHLLTQEVDGVYAGSVLGAWAMRYLDIRFTPDPDLDPHDHRAVVRIERDNYRTEVRAGGHALITDEPVALGGTNSGPTPYDLLIGGLGACTAITIRMYADRKGWPVEAVEVRLTHRKVPADQVDCEWTKSGKVDVIDREVTLFGELDESQRARLLEIANRCPVHRTIDGGPCVRTYERRPEALGR